MAADHVKITVPYHEYKLRYRNLPFVPNSYNKKDNTIMVCMTKALADRFAERKLAQEKARVERTQKKAKAKA